MSPHHQAIVIGGGVVGCSVLYHLTKAGWKDVLLLERRELTCGSTWHAAGGVHTLNGDPNVAKLQQYTIALYDEIEKISGQSCGLHLTGGIMLAGTKERLEWLKMAHARGRYLGMDTEVITAKEAEDRMPLLDPKHFTGALWDPMEGHLDPSGVTHAYAKSAKIGGASIERQTKVESIEQTPDGTWRLQTDKGEFRAEHVVNAGGLWAREVGRMVGLELPILAMEHMYFLTEDMDAVIEFDRGRDEELPHAIDFEGELYLRQEGRGMLLGTYEQACKPWSPENTPWTFDTELLEPDIERLAPSLEVGFAHFPPFATTGIKKIINGPFTFAPDGNPLIGPVRGLTNFWLACGVMAGFSQGGGVGLALSQWMVNGDPGFDIWGMDASRYGDWASLAYTNAKVRENYSRRFRIRFPNEELPAARPLKTTPIYGELAKRGAVFGDSWGLEHALWFARPGKDEAVDHFSFRRANDFEAVGEEARAVRQGVGLLEISNFAKHEVSGPAAAQWLDRIFTCRLPAVGRIALAPMLDHRGMLIGDFTLARAAEDRFYLFGSGIAEEYQCRWFSQQMPASGAHHQSLGLNLLGLSLAGPRSRELLGRLTRQKLDNENFPFLSFARMDVGMIPALVGRISFSGELGYEMWVQPQYLLSLYNTLLEEGHDLAIRPFGGRALNSLRLEKSWGSWAREYRPIYTPFEAGLDRFVALEKGDFIGRDAALAARESGLRQKLLTFAVEADDTDVIGDEPIWRDGEVVGWVTSGGYAHCSRQSVALGYVRAPKIDLDAGYEIEIIGDRRPARILKEPLHDPQARLMRG